MLPNDVKLRLYVIDQLETYFVMAKNIEISSIANTIKQLHIQKNMHLLYQQDFYKDKQKEIYKLFIEKLVPIMDYLYQPALIEEWKQNIDAADYEKNQNQYVKLPSIKKKNDCNYKTEYWPTSINESLHWFPFIYIMDFTAERIEYDKKLLPSLLKIISMFKIKCWYSQWGADKNT